jgi:hypothetical protein
MSVGISDNEQSSSEARTLRAIKLAHTIIWAFLAFSIVAIPVASWSGSFRVALVLIAVVLVEVLVIILNKGRCPLTNIAANYTDNRRDNFDIYLPEWLARHNKVIFGILYILGVVVTFTLWVGGPAN